MTGFSNTFVQTMDLSDLLAKSYANEMHKNYYTIRKNNCDGCKFGLLSQIDHSLCFLDLKDQVLYLFDYLLDEIEDESVISKFELLLSDNSMKLGDFYLITIPIFFWRRGVFHHEFIPELKQKTVLFLLQKLTSP